MTELKTLNDLIGTCNSYPKCNQVCVKIDFRKLKEEAIKWLKELRAVNNDMEDFMKFFNITEEDLK